VKTRPPNQRYEHRRDLTPPLSYHNNNNENASSLNTSSLISGVLSQHNSNTSSMMDHQSYLRQSLPMGFGGSSTGGRGSMLRKPHDVFHASAKRALFTSTTNTDCKYSLVEHNYSKPVGLTVPLRQQQTATNMPRQPSMLQRFGSRLLWPFPSLAGSILGTSSDFSAASRIHPSVSSINGARGQ
jgi:hypothetical protein